MDKSHTGHGGLRQPENRQRQSGLPGKKQDLFSGQFAPGITKQSDGVLLFHGCQVRLHLVVDAAALELAGEGKKVLREHGHGRSVEQVLEALAQTQFEHIVKAERIELADGHIGGRETDGGSQMVDGVDPPAEVVELPFPQPESGLAEISRHHSDARGERLIPDFSFFEGSAQALAPTRGIVGPDQAVHDQIRLLPQQVVQQETTDESGGSGQQDLSKISRRHGIGRPLLADGGMNESTQCIDVSLAMRGQGPDDRLHRRVGVGSFGHTLLPWNRANWARHSRLPPSA